MEIIPLDTDILITHGPPHGILDEVPRKYWIENTGCEELRKKVEEIARKRIFSGIFIAVMVKRKNLA